MSAKASPQELAALVMQQLGHELNDAEEAIEEVVTKAVTDETNRCLRWLRISDSTREAIDHIEQYDEPPDDEPAAAPPGGQGEPR